MHRCPLRQIDPEKGSQGQAVGAAPGDASLTAQSFKVTDEEHPEVIPRWNAGSSSLLVVGIAQPFDKIIIASRLKHFIEFGVEGMPGAWGDLIGGYEQVLLLFFASSNGHTFQTPSILGGSIESGLF